MTNLSHILTTSLNAMGLTLGKESEDKLLRYLTLLQQWNKAYNLIAAAPDEYVLTHHILDSLSIAPYLTGLRVIDIGTGAGLPGIPLAIAQPERQFTLIDSNGKKTRFLHQVRHALSLSNVEVVTARVESFNSAIKYDAIITRAVASLSDLVQMSRHLLATHGSIYAMKGKLPAEELAALAEAFTIQSYPLRVSGLDAKRHLVILKEK